MDKLERIGPGLLERPPCSKCKTDGFCKAHPKGLSREESANVRRELGLPELFEPSLPTCPRCEIAKAALERIAEWCQNDGSVRREASEALAEMEKATNPK